MFSEKIKLRVILSQCTEENDKSRRTLRSVLKKEGIFWHVDI